MEIKWFRNRYVILLAHILAWIVLFSLPMLLRPSYHEEKQHIEPISPAVTFIIFRLNDIFLISFFYFNAWVLIPLFFYKKEWIKYMFSLAAAFSVLVCISWFMMINFTYHDQGFTFRKHLFFSTMGFIFMLACSITFKIVSDKIVSDKLAGEKENENLKTELSLLRMQVSPHFMFNVLNNMVALARKQSPLLEPSLIKLSSLMRYMLYETGEAKVPLEKETEYLQSYIDLQEQRFGKKVVINVTIGNTGGEHEIEPMLLIPFVENAFKHGTGMIANPQIDISLFAENNKLTLFVSNKYDSASKEIKDEHHGIGLHNVQRRLDLLYGTKYELLINSNDDTFTVALKIELTS